MYGKIMSLPDELIVKYFRLCTNVSNEAIKEIEQDLKAGKNPRDYKMKLAYQLVKQYHSEKDAQAAEQAFIKQFQKKKFLMISRPLKFPSQN